MPIFSHKVLPAVFDDSLSYYELICKLTDKVNELVNVEQELQDFINQMNQTVDNLQGQITDNKTAISELSDTVEKYHELVMLYLTQLYELIKKLNENVLQWDVQKGLHVASMDAQRDMFNDVTIHGITCADLAEIDGITVAGLADCGLNVRGVAIVGLWLLDNFDIPKYFKYTEGGGDGEPLTPISLSNAYINEEGLVYINGND